MYSRAYVEDNTILLALTGSRAYNLHTPSSDYDYRGIMCRDSKDSYLSYQGFEQKDGGWLTEPAHKFNMLGKDTVIYDVQKFIALANKCNPNILELLFMDEEIYISNAGGYLKSNRELFLNPSLQKTYVGYAYSQIKRMENHRYWLLNPEQKKPTPEDFGFSQTYKILTKGDLFSFLEFLYTCVRNNIEYLQPTEEFHDFLFNNFDFKAVFKNSPLDTSVLTKIAEITGSDINYVLKVQKSKEYYAALKRYENYQRWLSNRNPERARFEAKCGYDTKHASHCLRLLYQAEYVLNYGYIIVNVDKFDDGRDLYLREVKAGNISYENLKYTVDRLFEDVKSKDFSVLNKPLSQEKLSEIFLETLHIHEADTY